MALPRFYCRSIDYPLVQLSASQSHHLASVLRLSRGDKAELFDGAGTLASAVAETVNPRRAALQVLDSQVLPRPFNSYITIAVSIAKGHRFDQLIGKCTELGVDRICPVLFERTVKQPKNPKIINRWRDVAIAAAKQCRRLYLPHIDTPLSLPDALKVLKSSFPQAGLLIGSLSGDLPFLINQSFGPDDVIAFIGPEGGLTAEEESLLRANGSQCVRITDTILRIETAALAFASILTAQRSAQKK